MSDFEDEEPASGEELGGSGEEASAPLGCGAASSPGRASVAPHGPRSFDAARDRPSSDRTGEEAAPSPPRPNRVIGLERTGSARRTVYVPLKRRAKRFLEALEACGNVTMAREAAGLGKDRVYLHRRENEEFAAGWEAALAAFRARADEEEGIDLDALEKEGLAVRRGPGGHVQIVSAHPRAWRRRDEDLFFALYAESGNVAAAARAAGFSGKAAWERARTHADFARRLAEAKEEATERLHFHLVEEGTNLLRSEKRDPQLAMWLLKREDQRQAGTLRRGAAAARVPAIEDVADKIVRNIEAIERHENRARLADGWTRTEDGHWIPPGYGWVG